MHWMGAAKEILGALPPWAADVPYQIKKIAIKDASLATQAARKKGGATKYRTKRTPRQSCFIPHSALKTSGLYHTIAGKLRLTEALPENHKDSRLVCEHGRWFVVVPYSLKAKNLNPDDQRIVALDPGIRTFLTGFSETSVFKIGEAAFSGIMRLVVRMDGIVGRMANAKSGRKQNLRRALSRMRFKVWDLVDELHWKAIKFLTDRFDVIILPTFETKKMSCRKKRKIRAKTVRAMSTFRFFEFSQRLQHKAAELGKLVVRCSEAYTSKTASWTGEVLKVGSSTAIKSRGTTLDRDINGARGIFLRALRDNSGPEAGTVTVNLC